MPVICSPVDDLAEERWPCCAVHTDRRRLACMQWCAVLTGGCHLVISRRYHTRRARMHIDPGTWVQPVNGVILILSSPSASHCFPFSVLSFTHTFVFSALPSTPRPSDFCFSSDLFSHPCSLASIHPHGSNSLSGLSYGLQASRQSLQRLLQQKTQSFKQHYVGSACSISHTDTWKRRPLRHCLCMGMMQTGAGQSFSFQSLRWKNCSQFQYCYNTSRDVRQNLVFVWIRQPYTFVSRSMQNKAASFWERRCIFLLSSRIICYEIIPEQISLRRSMWSQVTKIVVAKTEQEHESCMQLITSPIFVVSFVMFK